MRGIVIKSVGLWTQVLGEDHTPYLCRLKGSLRLKKYKESHAVAVGDKVQFDDHNMITERLSRKNIIERRSGKSNSHSNVLATNIDQVLLMATIKNPVTSTGFIDRFFVSAESFRIPQIIVFNKKDLLCTPEDYKKQDELINIYRSIGVKTILFSTSHDSDMSLITAYLHGATTLVVGLSGTGKSTLLNRIIPIASRAVGDISHFSHQGKHTTSYAEMIAFNKESFIIDTPGVREWQPTTMTPEELSDYFPEMRKQRPYCKLKARCIHITEPDCAVLNAVKKGAIATHRYRSYVGLIEDKDNRR